MKRRLWLGFLLAIFLCSIWGISVHAEKKPKLLILLVNDIDWSDLNQVRSPNLRRLIREGAVGWINVKNYRGYSPSSSYLTMGMSNRTKLDDKTGLAFGSDEPIPGFANVTGGQYYQQFTGYKPFPGGIVVPDLAKIKTMANDVDPLAVPGFLGDLLKKKGYRAALFGNADLPGEFHREAALMLMDTTGRIPIGSVGLELLKNDPAAPFGWRTDYAKIRTKIKAIADKADIIAVETGDTSRIESGADLFSTKMLAKSRQNALKSLDPFIGWMIADIQPDSILLFGVNPNADMIKAGNTGLAPIVLYGKGKGLLASASTHRAGYMTNLDLAATICALSGIPLTELGKGFPVRVDSSHLGADHLIFEGNYFSALRAARYPVNNGLVIFFIVIIIAGIFAFRFKFNPFWIRFYLWLLGTLILLPIGILTGGVAGYTPVWPPLLIALVVAAGGAFLLLKFLPTRRAFIAMLFGVPSLILLDTFLGGQWMLHSAMGSDLIAGGRFFGMGNDLMGVVVGCLVAGISVVIQEFPGSRRSAPWWATLFFLVALAGIGLPMFGANVGGTIVGFTAGALSVLVLSGTKVSWRKMFLIFSGAVVVTVLIACADALFNPHPTHAGRAILLLADSGSTGFIQIVTIKLQILFGTIGGSMYSWLFLTELLAFWAFKYVQPDFLPKFRLENPYWHRMMKTLGITCFLAIAVKDTGIIAAALILSYYWLTVYGMALESPQTANFIQKEAPQVTT